MNNDYNQKFEDFFNLLDDDKCGKISRAEVIFAFIQFKDLIKDIAMEKLESKSLAEDVEINIDEVKILIESIIGNPE